MRESSSESATPREFRIPRPLLKETALSGEVDLEVGDSHTIIRPSEHPRQGWEESFGLMGERQDDRLLDTDLTGRTRWDHEEWEW